MPTRDTIGHTHLTSTVSECDTSGCPRRENPGERGCSGRPRRRDHTSRTKTNCPATSGCGTTSNAAPEAEPRCHAMGEPSPRKGQRRMRPWAAAVATAEVRESAPSLV